MTVASKAKDAGASVLGLAAVVVFIAIPIALLYGAAELSLWALKWTPAVFGTVFWATVLVLVPLAIIPPTRGWSALGFVIASYLFGLLLWIWAMAFTYDVWGLGAVVIGLLIFGAGVVAVAMLAALIKGVWAVLGTFIFLLVLTLGTRAFGHWLGATYAQRAARKAEARFQTVTVEPARRRAGGE